MVIVDFHPDQFYIFSSNTFANLYECQMKPKKIKGTYWISSKNS